MKNKVWRSLLALLILSAFSPLQGETYRRGPVSQGASFDIHKAQVTFLNDLPDKEVKDFLQDSDGYLWIATQNGLFRYDGYKYQTFRSDLNHPGLISGNELMALTEDKDKRIWFASTAGLDRFDKKTGTLEHLTEVGDMPTSRVTALLSAKDGSVWIGNIAGLWQYRPTDQSYICLTKALSDIQPSVGIKCLFEDSRGDIWIGTWARGLFRYERLTGQIIEYPNINSRNAVSSICEDNQHRIWVGSWDCGIQVIENAWNMNNYQVTTIDKQHSGLAHDIIYTVCADPSSQNIFVGTPKGLTVFDATRPPFKPRNISDPNGMVYPGEQLVSFHLGHNGLYWVGMKGKGLCSIDPEGNKFDLNPNFEVSRRHGTTGCLSMLVDQRGRLFEALTTTGFVITDTATGAFINWQDFPELSHEKTLSTVEDIIESRRDGHIWMTCRSMFVLEIDMNAPVGRRVKKYSTDNCPWMTSNYVNSLLEDHNSNLWLGGYLNFTRKNSDGSYLLLDTISISDGRTLKNVIIYDMDEDGDGHIWLATQKDGLIRVTENNGVWTAKLYNWANGLLQADNVVCVHADCKGRIWAGSASCGLHIYRPEQDAFELLQKKWQIPGDAVNSIVEETASSLWLGTNAGIVSLTINSDAQLAKMRRFQREDGLQDNIFNRNAATRASDGRIFMGGNLGYNSFYPKDLLESKNELNCNVTDIKVESESWFSMPGQLQRALSVQAPEYTESITLDYDQRSLALRFSSFDYTHLDHVHYQYILEGLDKRPTLTDGRNHEAYYSNLSPGDYTFKLGLADGNYVRTIRIHVNPPFWLSWWAYCIYFLLLSASIYLIVQWIKQRMHRIQNLRMRVFERTRRENLRVAELQASVIAQTRDEMQQKFKQELLTANDRTKLVFEAQEVEINSSDEEFLRKALDCINRNLDNANYDQQQFIIDMGISKSTCFRKLKSLTGMGFASIIRDVRMNAACRILKEKRGIRVSELAYAVGYSDPRYFSTCFKKEFGMMPSEFADYVQNEKADPQQPAQE